MNAPGKHAALGAIDAATIELAEQLRKLARLTEEAQDHLVVGRPLGELPAAILKEAILADVAGSERAAAWKEAHEHGASLDELRAAGMTEPPCSRDTAHCGDCGSTDLSQGPRGPECADCTGDLVNPDACLGGH